MFPLIFDVKITGQGMQKRNVNKYVNLSLKAMLFEWFLRFFDRHFKRSAPSRYPGIYKKRRRQRGRANPRPNVRTGRMMRQLKQSFRVVGTSKLMRGVMKGPSYTDLGRTGTGGKQPDKAREITWISRSEQRYLARFFGNTLTALINEDKQTKRIKIR
jgi:hypothetical protein